MSHRVDPQPARQQRAVGDTGRPSAPTVAKVEPVQTPAAPSPVAPPPVASGSVVPAALPSTYVGSDLSWDSGRSKIVSHFRPSLPSHPGVVGDELQAALDEVATGPEAVAAKTRGFFEAFGTSSFKRASQALAAMTVEEFSALPPRAQFAVAERVAIRRAQEPASSQWAVISRAVGLVEARSLMPVDPKGVFPSEPPTDAAARLARDLGGPFVRLSQGLDADISASEHESASALSALGLSPARANVMLLDRSSGQATFVEHRGLSALVTHLGRINAAALEAGALTVGRKHEPDELLDDAPEPFHQLLMKAAKTGAPLAGDLEPGAQGAPRTAPRRHRHRAVASGLGVER